MPYFSRLKSRISRIVAQNKRESNRPHRIWTIEKPVDKFLRLLLSSLSQVCLAAFSVVIATPSGCVSRAVRASVWGNGRAFCRPSAKGPTPFAERSAKGPTPTVGKRPARSKRSKAPSGARSGQNNLTPRDASSSGTAQPPQPLPLKSLTGTLLRRCRQCWSPKGSPGRTSGPRAARPTPRRSPCRRRVVDPGSLVTLC
eukprot:SAG31_NODE_903_length_11121_cov_10.117311_6_plen_199_part_00